MAVQWILIALITFIAASLLLHIFATKKKKIFPPGPKGIPILGHLHMLGKNPHQDLQHLAKKHGPLMYLRFGFAPIIVVSSPESAELFLKTHDLVFASRPPNKAFQCISWDQTGLVFGTYGPYWRSMRKLCTFELLSNVRINSFQSMRREELSFFVQSLKKESSSNDIVVDLSAKVSSLAAEMSCRMVFGKKYEDKDIHEIGFKGLFQEGMKYVAVPNVGDYFPFLDVFDVQGLNRKMKALAKVFDDFFEKVIDDHVRVGDHGQKKDIVDTMMSIMQSGEAEFRIDHRHVKSIMLDMLVASMDTLASTVEWLFSELLKDPRIMKKLQTELEEVVGFERPVEESDLDQLDYLNMVVKETFRLHPVAPLLLPHYAREDCTVNGYHIPNGSRVLVNTYAIGRDPTVWSDPEKFIPERFIGSDLDVRGKHFKLLAFGTGRRGCPGIQLGLIQVQLIVAQLVHCFDWKLGDGMKPEDLDMDEEFGLVLSRAKHLMVIPSYRLNV